MDALETLAKISGRQPEPGSLLPWPLTTYQGLGLKDIEVVVREEQRALQLQPAMESEEKELLERQENGRGNVEERGVKAVIDLQGVSWKWKGERLHR